MTNKEWKELCNWVKSLNTKHCFIDEFNEEEVILAGIYGGDYLEITKNGEIIEFDYGSLIAENRTQKQIKAIIKNLVEEAEE